MSDHLSAWEIEELLIEPIEPENHPARQHLSACELCTGKMRQLEEPLLLYREAALSLTGRVSVSDLAVGKAARRFSPASLNPWRWGLAMLLLLVAMLPLYVRREQRQRDATELNRDNLLLQQVDQEVSGSVPQPLESLTHLVVAESQSSAASGAEQ